MPHNAESVYLFRHALLREAAQELQLPQDRARLHGLAVDIMAELLRGRPEMLDGAALEMADHANAAAQQEGRAQHYARLECGYLRRALGHAGRRYAHGVVITAGRRLLASPYLEVNDRAEVAHSMGTAHRHCGQVDEALEGFRQAAASAQKAVERGRALVGQADVYSNLARYAEAERCFNEALACLGPEDGGFYAEALRQLGTLHLRRQDHAQGVPLTQRALQASHDANDPACAAGCEVNLGLVAMHTGRTQESEQHLQRALELAKRANDDTTLALAAENLGTLLAHLNRMEEANGWFKIALETTRQMGNLPAHASTLTNFGHALVEAGSHESAESIMLQAIEMHRESRNVGKIAQTLGNLAVLYLRTGRGAEGRRLNLEAIELHRQAGNQGSECVARLNLSWTLFEEGRHDEALAQIAVAAATATAIGDPRLQGYAVCNEVIIRATRDSGQPDRQGWQRGVELVRQSGDLRAVERLQSDFSKRFPAGDVS
ncbi:MAG: tetratricopeptide repeat protein [Planctomycetes bacterium]|nr:tetratricopeptide repeat protein [Planctomycetota bacterium]MCW8135400.1 tetratricopeptide repeat protein [Planctomycetota bacterium]